MVAQVKASAASRRETLMSRRQIEGLIAEGKAIIIVDQKVLKVDPWMDYHPGGALPIKHVVGRDATDEVTALHGADTKQSMFRYQIGRVEGRWKNFVPPIRGGKFRPYVEGDENGCDKEEDEDDESISSNSSTTASIPPTPIFDGAEPAPSGARRRTAARERSCSVSSMSSLEETPATKPDDGMGHLDVLTREEIELDLAKYPALDEDTQADIVRKYRDLMEHIRAAGLFECNYWMYGIECCRYALFFSLMLYFLHIGWYCTSAVFMGVFWHQLVFSAHDAGHMGITHNFTLDSVIGILIADYLGGLSLGWWKKSHNVHHIITNSPEHDPDIEHMPFFAVSHRLFTSLWSTYYDRLMEFDAFAKVFLPFQGWSYYPILGLGRFNLYVLSWTFLIQGQGPRKGPAWWLRYFEIGGQFFFWYWFGYQLVYRSIPTGWDRFCFVMISHIVTMPVHVQITLSHFAMSTSDLGPRESFPQRMLRTTMDVDCPTWLDFFHGGLQFQAIHHLYPRIPRHNLRTAQKLVQAFCDDVGIPYALYGFVDGNKKVIGHLGEVGRQAAILIKCQRALAENPSLAH